ncbi:MAG: hypothetical protein DRP08_06920, partial [Candidatus Aenigmatarchaeota archaeon]
YKELDKIIKKEGLLFNVFYNGASQKEKRKILLNEAKAPFEWNDILAEPGTISTPSDGIPSDVKRIPMRYIEQPNDYIPTLMERLFGIWRSYEWLNFFSFETNENTLNWKQKTIKFHVPSIRKQSYATPHNRISHSVTEVEGTSVFGGIGISLPYDYKLKNQGKFQVQKLILHEMALAIQAEIDFHSLLALEIIINNGDPYHKVRINFDGKKFDGSLRDYLEKKDWVWKAIFNKYPARGMTKLISILTDRVLIFNKSAYSSTTGEATWGLFLPKVICDKIILNDKNYEARYVSHKLKEGFYNRENDISPTSYYIRGVHIYPVSPFSPDKSAGLDPIQPLDSYKRETIFNYFYPANEISDRDNPYDERKNKLYIHNLKSNKYDQIMFKDAVKNLSKNDKAKLYDGLNALDVFNSVLDKFIVSKVKMHRQTTIDDYDSMRAKIGRKVTKDNFNSYQVEFMSRMTKYVKYKGGGDAANLFKKIKDNTYTSIDFAMADIKVGETKASRIDKMDFPITSHVVGMFRGMIKKTASCFFVRKYAMALKSGDREVELISDKASKYYYADFEKMYGVELRDPNNCMLITDIFYYDGYHKGYIPCNKFYKAGAKNNGGKIIPFLMTMEGAERAAGSFIPTSGTVRGVYDNIIASRDHVNPYFATDSGNVNLTHFNNEFGGMHTLHKFFIEKHKRGMVRKAEMAFQGFQRGYNHTEDKYTNEHQQYGYLKHVIKPLKK